AVLAIRDPVKAEARSAIAALHRMGIRTVIISGDNVEVARAVAARLGIDEFHAQLMPADKIALVKRYQDSGLFTAMVGDGINDAPALAAADIGIAIGSGTDAAKETGDVVLTRDDLYDIVRALVLGRLTLNKVKQNLFWAFFYNVIGIPMHCDRPMHIEQVGDKTRLVCWMGASCGVADVPKHCDAPMHDAA